MSTPKSKKRPRATRRTPATESTPIKDSGPSPSPSAPSTSDDSGTRSLELLAQVRSGTLAGSLLKPADRQSLVMLLSADGLSTPEIAQILHVHERTIERDRQAIRNAQALPRDPRLVEMMAGRLLAEAELCLQRIRRTARDREVDPAIKIDAEHRCFQITSELIQRLQGLGILPLATQRVQADVLHRDAQLPPLSDLEQELTRLESITTGDGEAARQVLELRQVVVRARVATGLDLLGRSSADADRRELPDADRA